MRASFYGTDSLMKTAFDIYLKTKKILVFPHGKNLAGEEIQAALDDLVDAKKAFARQRYNWATIQGYWALFHAARALLKGYLYNDTK